MLCASGCTKKRRFAQRKAVKLGKGLECKSDEELLEGGGCVLSLEKRLRRGLVTRYNHLKGGCSQVEIGVLSQTTNKRTKRVLSCAEGDLSWPLGRISDRKGG